MSGTDAQPPDIFVPLHPELDAAIAREQKWRQMLSGLEVAAAATTRQAKPFNPRPSGSLVPGSASHQVLSYLQQRGARCRTHSIVSAVNRPPSTVRWALIWLRAQGYILSRPSGVATTYVWWVPTHQGARRLDDPSRTTAESVG